MAAWKEEQKNVISAQITYMNSSGTNRDILKREILATMIKMKTQE